MRVFLFEYICSGAWPDQELATSLAVEGRAMTEALGADLAKLPHIEVVMTWDARLAPPKVDNLNIISTTSPAFELQCFRRLARECDATFIIAPEFDGILQSRRRLVDTVGGRCLGPTEAAIALCSDKLAVARHFQEHNVPTVPTRPWDAGATVNSANCGDLGEAQNVFTDPLVIKPQFGAGSQSTFLVENRQAEVLLARQLAGDQQLLPMIQQPFIPGRALSVAGMNSPGGSASDVFPITEQCLSNDGRFQYLGGRLPAELDPQARLRVAEVVKQACDCLPGLLGFVGFDVILSKDAGSAPLIVDVNPRLTTSYAGYRVATTSNLAEYWLAAGSQPHTPLPPIVWNNKPVLFAADGRIEFL